MHLACINLGYVYQTMALVQGVEPCFVAWWTRRLELNQHLFAHYIMLLLESYCPTVRRHQHFLLLYPICPQRHLKEDVAVITISLSRRKMRRKPKNSSWFLYCSLKSEVSTPCNIKSNTNTTPLSWGYLPINQPTKEIKTQFWYIQANLLFKSFKWWRWPVLPGL